MCYHFVWSAEYYCPSVSTKGDDRRTDNSTFRLVQFNAEWLFVDGADNCPGTTCPWGDSKAASTHLSTIAGVIADLKPDLLNLCEVESCDELTLLTQDSQLKDIPYKPYMIHGTDDSTGQDVGMLTLVDPLQDLYRTEVRVTYPIAGTTCTSSYTGSYGVSKHYITTLSVGGMKTALISMHLLGKSHYKSPSFSLFTPVFLCYLQPFLRTRVVVSNARLRLLSSSRRLLPWWNRVMRSS